MLLLQTQHMLHCALQGQLVQIVLHICQCEGQTIMQL